ncbi:MAG: MFS transporter [Jatrophihabitantaceae bacterium]
MTTRVEDVTFRGLFTNRDFAVLYATGTQSQLGDQLARVALTVLVFTRTGSAFLTATTYALTFLPALIGGITLSGLADTKPRRTLLVGCDAVRAVVYALMAIPRVPLVAVCVLLVLAVLMGSPYNAAEPALVADIFDGPRYLAAIGLRTATLQAAQLVGFAAGGLVVAVTGARAALLIDAATFAASAIILRLLLSSYPAASGGQRTAGQVRRGVRAVAADPRLRVLLGFAWLMALWVIPEGLAAPYADAHGGGATSVGILLAANPAGNLLGTLLLTRWIPSASRERLLGVLAFASGLPLLMCAAGPPISLAVLLWGVCGVFTAYLVVVIAEFVAIVPSTVRGQAIGLASASLLAAQGIGLIVGGAMDTVWGTGTAIAVAGGLGSLLALPLALARHRLREVESAGERSDTVRGAHRMGG